MTTKTNTDNRAYRHRVNALLQQLDTLRHRQNLLQAAGVRGRGLTKLEQKTEHLRHELAATIATRPHSTNPAANPT